MGASRDELTKQNKSRYVQWLIEIQFLQRLESFHWCLFLWYKLQLVRVSWKCMSDPWVWRKWYKCRHHYLSFGPIHPCGPTALCPQAQLWLDGLIYVLFTMVDEVMGHFKHEKLKWTWIYQRSCPSVPLTEKLIGHWHFSEHWVA